MELRRRTFHLQRALAAIPSPATPYHLWIMILATEPSALTERTIQPRHPLRQHALLRFTLLAQCQYDGFVELFQSLVGGDVVESDLVVNDFSVMTDDNPQGER